MALLKGVTLLLHEADGRACPVLLDCRCGALVWRPQGARACTQCDPAARLRPQPP